MQTDESSCMIKWSELLNGYSTSDFGRLSNTITQQRDVVVILSWKQKCTNKICLLSRWLSMRDWGVLYANVNSICCCCFGWISWKKNLNVPLLHHAGWLLFFSLFIFAFLIQDESRMNTATCRSYSSSFERQTHLCVGK